MIIRNNYQGIDLKLLQEAFPYAYKVEKPEIIKNVDGFDRILAMVTDHAGRTCLTSYIIGEMYNSTHWPGIFGWYGKDCPEKCFWVENKYSPLCDHCSHK